MTQRYLSLQMQLQEKMINAPSENISTHCAIVVLSTMWEFGNANQITSNLI